MAVTQQGPVLAPAPHPANPDEPDLVERMARGDARAFDELVILHQARVTRLASRLLGWTGPVEDVVQEAFLAAFRQRRRFRGQSSLSTWLTAITLNRCRSVRRGWRGRWRRLKEVAWSRPATGQEPADEPASRDEVSQRVREAVQQLAPADREVIVLYYLEQMSVARMAQLLDARPNAIDVRLHRARQRLRGKLAGMDEGGEL